MKGNSTFSIRLYLYENEANRFLFCTAEIDNRYQTRVIFSLHGGTKVNVQFGLLTCDIPLDSFLQQMSYPPKSPYQLYRKLLLSRPTLPI